MNKAEQILHDAKQVASMYGQPFESCALSVRCGYLEAHVVELCQMLEQSLQEYQNAVEEIQIINSKLKGLL
jgi:hypothetical protein